MHTHRFVRDGLAAALTLLIACDDAGSPLDAVRDGPTSGAAGAEVDLELPVAGAPVEFSDLSIFLEYNATDEDLGVQIFLDAEDWDRLRARDPLGRTVLSFRALGELGDLGLTELRFESAEPSPAEVLEAIPAGDYGFDGRTVEGGRLTGSAVLSHDLPPAPVFTPADGDVVDAANTVIAWDPIAGVAGWEIIVADEDSGAELTVILGPDATSLTVPAEFMAEGTEYKAEVLAVASSGNKTITEHTFTTAN